MGFGADYAKDLPPPEKLGKAPPRSGEGSPEEEGAESPDDEAAEQAAAEASAMEEFDAAKGPDERAAALKRFIEICKPGY